MKRTFVIREQANAETLALFLAGNWRSMAERGEPMQVTCSIYRASRTNDQLAAMWAGIIQPLADQAWIGGRQYSAEVWHEWLKRETIPAMAADQTEPGQWVKNGSTLWRYMPDGSREFCGSTGMLTRAGMSEYMQRIEAYAVSEHGVRLPTRPVDM